MAPLVLSLALGAAPAEPAPPPHPSRARALAPAIIAGATLLGGAAFLTVGQVQWNRAGGRPAEEADAARAGATSNVVGGVALLGLGALSAALAAVLFWWTPAQSPRVAFAPLPGGGLLALEACLP